MRFLIPFFLLLFFCGCTEPAETRFDKIARAYCECTGKLVDLNKKTAALATDSTAHAAFQENLRQIQEIYDKARVCNATIVAQFGKLKPAEIDSLTLTLATGACPDLSREPDLLKEMLGE